MFDRGEIDGRMHRMEQALPTKPFSTSMPKVVPPKPNVFKVGPLTMAHVFSPNGITDVSDWQRVLDAVEAALARD